MERRKFTREFQLEAVRLVKERGVSAAQASRDLDVHQTVLRKWLADQVPVLLGNYSGQPSHAVTALDGIKAAFPNAEVTYVSGTNFLRQLEAVAAAKSADVVIAAVGIPATFPALPGRATASWPRAPIA